jgi:hypothetical protein
MYKVFVSMYEVCMCRCACVVVCVNAWVGEGVCGGISSC